MLASLSQPTTQHEWNRILQQMVEQKEDGPRQKEEGHETAEEQIVRLKLLRNRRQTNRPINGAIEWYLIEPKTKQEASLKQAILDTLQQIESIEVELIQGEERTKQTGNYMMNHMRNKQFILSQYKLKLNRLQDEYKTLVKKWNGRNKGKYTGTFCGNGEQWQK